MIDSKAYHKIIKYLDKGELEKLKLYLEVEYNEMYINKAVKALYNYKKNVSPFLGYSLLPGNRLLIGSNYSLFLFNSQEILDAYPLEIGQEIMELGAYDTEKYLGLLNEDRKSNYSPVTKIELETPVKDSSKSEFRIKSKTDRVGSTFYKRMLDFSKIMLGNNLEYSLKDNYPSLIAKSEKGKGYILGLHNSSKH